MDLKVVKKEEQKLVILLKGIDESYANTLRRIILTEVPTLAIKQVTLVKNSSALFDEIVAHRLGMLPLVTDLEMFTRPEKCTCKGAGCAKCQISFTLKAEGPITVYAEDLKCVDPKVKAVFGKMPIVMLLKGQELEFEAVASLGTGKEHVKFAPGHVYYKGNPKITIDKVKDPDFIAKLCPTNVFNAEGKQLKVADTERCILCNACVDENDPKGGITVEASTTDFLFYLESYGKLSCKEILTIALDMLDEKIDVISLAVEK